MVSGAGRGHRRHHLVALTGQRLGTGVRPAAASSVNDRDIICRLERDNWLETFGTGLPQGNRFLGGLGLGLEHVVSVRAFLTRFGEDFEAMNWIYASYFPADRRPARICVGVTGLARDARVEIDMIAHRP